MMKHIDATALGWKLIAFALCGLASSQAQEIGECGFLNFVEAPQQARPILFEERSLYTDHFKIHFTFSGGDSTTQTWVDSVAAFAEQSYNVANELNFELPLPDGTAGGDSLCDIYVMNMPGGNYGQALTEHNYVSPKYMNGRAAWIELHRDSIPRDRPRFDGLKSLVSHEFHHACQLAYNGFSLSWFGENTSVWFEDEAFDQVDMIIWRFDHSPDPLDSTELRIWDDNVKYTGGIWPTFLDEAYGSGIVKDIWEAIGNSGVRDPLSAIISTLASPSCGSSLDEALEQYAIWRYFTGTRSDGFHFSEGAIWPTSKVCKSHNYYPAFGVGFTSSCGGAYFAEFKNGGDTLNILVDGEDLINWSAFIVKYAYPSSSTVTRIGLDEGGSGSINMPWGGNHLTLIAVARDGGAYEDLSASYVASIPSFLPIQITNLARSVNLGGHFEIDDAIVVPSGDSVSMAPGSNHLEETLNERFTSDSVYKHLNWNSVSSNFRIRQLFQVNHGAHQRANFQGLCPAHLRASILDGASGAKFEFRDPWYLHSDGNQPDSFFVYTDSLLPTGAHNATAGGVFLDARNLPGRPYYSVRALVTQPVTISGTQLPAHFQHWSSTNVDIVAPDSAASGYYTTPVVFRSGSPRAVTAFYKVNKYSLSSLGTTGNNQRKIATNSVWGSGWCLVYESQGTVWLTYSLDGVNWIDEINISNGSYGTANAYPSIVMTENIANVVWQSNAYAPGWEVGYIHLRRFNLATGEVGPLELVSDYWCTSQNYAATPVIGALSLTASGGQDYKRIAWKTPGGIKIRDCNNGSWGTVGTVSGTNGNSTNPCIVCFNSSPSGYALVWADQPNATIRYSECSYASGNWSFPNQRQVSPVGWESNAAPSLGIVYTPPYRRPVVTWQSNNNVVEGGTSVHVRQGPVFGTGGNWTGNITSFSHAYTGNPQPVIGTFQSNSKMSVVWAMDGSIYKATYNGSTWTGMSVLGSGSAGGSGVNINSQTPYQLMTLWRKPSNVINTQTTGVNPTGERAPVGGDVMASVESSPASENSWSGEQGESVQYRLNRHAMVQVTDLLGDEYVPKSSIPKDEVRGFIAFEIAGTPGISGTEVGTISLRMPRSPEGFLGTEEHLLRTEPFAVDKSKGMVTFAGAIYGKELQIPADARKVLGNTLSRVTVRDAATDEVITTPWSVPATVLETIVDETFGEFRQFSVDLSRYAGRQVYIDIELIGSSRGTNPVFVDDYLITGTNLSTSPKELLVEEKHLGTTPAEYALHQNYPNPFNPTTTITFDLPEPQVVGLKIYDLLGQQIMVLLDGPLNAGRHSVTADFSGYPTGAYIYRLTAGNFQDTKRLLLLR